MTGVQTCALPISKTGAHFLIKNATTPFEQKYDEVICNLPFGLRVSNHRENRNLYQKFLQNLPSILVPNGLAFLFTNDKKLLSELLENSFELVKRENFEAGGLYPALYVLRLKKE